MSHFQRDIKDPRKHENKEKTTPEQGNPRKKLRVQILSLEK